jgi:hypothetical protein
MRSFSHQKSVCSSSDFCFAAAPSGQQWPQAKQVKQKPILSKFDEHETPRNLKTSQ